VPNFTRNTIPGIYNGLLSMPPNSQPANPTHGGTAVSQSLASIKKIKYKKNEFLL
jgi:hypothetical protein